MCHVQWLTVHCALGSADSMNHAFLQLFLGGHQSIRIWPGTPQMLRKYLLSGGQRTGLVCCSGFLPHFLPSLQDSKWKLTPGQRQLPVPSCRTQSSFPLRPEATTAAHSSCSHTAGTVYGKWSRSALSLQREPVVSDSPRQRGHNHPGIIFPNFYFIAIVMIREVNNTFKNLLRAKGCQSIYKDMGCG